jgi:hypothetical protein
LAECSVAIGISRLLTAFLGKPANSSLHIMPKKVNAVIVLKVWIFPSDSHFFSFVLGLFQFGVLQFGHIFGCSSVRDCQLSPHLSHWHCQRVTLIFLEVIQSS